MKIKLASILPALMFLISTALLADDHHNHHGRPAGRAPVLIVEINSAGDVRFQLTVYNDGGAVLARKDGDAPDGEICTATIPDAALAVFEDKMDEVDALQLPDQSPVPNTTRKTVSFFAEPGQSGRIHGNTFIYFRAEGPYLTVAQAISELYADPFQDCI